MHVKMFKITIKKQTWRLNFQKRVRVGKRKMGGRTKVQSRKHGFDPEQKIPWSKGMGAHRSTVACKISGRSLVGDSPQGSQESVTTKRPTTTNPEKYGNLLRGLKIKVVKLGEKISISSSRETHQMRR